MPNSVVAFSGQDVELSLIAIIDDVEEAPHIVRGFAGVSDAIKFEENQEIINAREGMDGYILFTRTGRRGGMMTVKMLPNAPSMPYLMTRAYTQKTGDKLIEWQGGIVLKGTGIEGSLKLGMMTHMPTFPSIGMNNIDDMQFSWYFTVIEADYSGANFDVFAADLP